MSWVDNEDVDSFQECLFDERGLDIHTSPLTHMSAHDISLQNISSPDEQPFLFATLIRDSVCDQSDDADSFFSTVEETLEKPALLVFASRDESVVGRCATVQRMGACIAVTIVHSCITLDDITDLAYVEGLESYVELHDELHFYMTAAHPHRCRVYLHALDDSSMLMATKVQLHLAKWMPKINSRQEGDAHGGVPDLAVLFANARGPVRQVTDVPDSVRCAITLMGGQVAVICVATDGKERLASDNFAGSLGARLVFMVSQHKTVLIDHLTSTVVFLRPDWPQIVMWGISMMHLAHVIGPACDLGSECGRKLCSGESCHQDLKRLLEEACDARAQKTIEVHHQQLADARSVIGRTVLSSLGRVKARLWRPDGPLVTSMMSEWS
jgi:hypothetical protein